MDELKYGEILKEIRPRIIETPEEYERLLSAAETLMEKGEELAEEEREVLALIVLLIKAFEAQVMEGEEDDEEEDEEEVAAPHEALQQLMQSHQVELDDIAPLFGTPGVAREVLAGERPITRSQAKQLSSFFQVPAKLFQES